MILYFSTFIFPSTAEEEIDKFVFFLFYFVFLAVFSIFLKFDFLVLEFFLFLSFFLFLKKIFAWEIEIKN